MSWGSDKPGSHSHAAAIRARAKGTGDAEAWLHGAADAMDAGHWADATAHLARAAAALRRQGRKDDGDQISDTVKTLRDAPLVDWDAAAMTDPRGNSDGTSVLQSNADPRIGETPDDWLGRQQVIRRQGIMDGTIDPRALSDDELAQHGKGNQVLLAETRRRVLAGSYLGGTDVKDSAARAGMKF